MKIEFFTEDDGRVWVTDRDIDHVPRKGDHVVIPGWDTSPKKVSQVVFAYEPIHHVQITVIDGDF